MKILLLSALLFFLTGCSSTSEKKDISKDVNLYRNLTSLNVNFIDNPDYFIYIIPKEIILDTEYNITSRGKKIIRTISQIHKKLKRNNVSIIGHSSTINEDPYEDSAEIINGTRRYIESVFDIENIVAFSKGSESPVFQKKSYNHFKKNERLEIIIIKNRE